MDTHLSRLALALTALGILHAAAGIAMTVLLGGTTFVFGAAQEQTFSTALASLTALLLMFTGALSIVAGVWLRQRLPRGRIAGLSAGFFLLLVFPLGTLLGAYAIWVLFQEEVDGRLRPRMPLP
jgi:hypothetical protein